MTPASLRVLGISLQLWQGTSRMDRHMGIHLILFPHPASVLPGLEKDRLCALPCLDLSALYTPVRDGWAALDKE